MSKPSQLDNMLEQAYRIGSIPRFVNLARRKLKRLRKEKREGELDRTNIVWKALKMLPDLKQKARLSERLKNERKQIRFSNG